MTDKDDVVSNKEEKLDNIDIGEEIKQFVTGIDSLLASIGPVLFRLSFEERNQTEKMNDFARKYGEIEKTDDNNTIYRFLPIYAVRVQSQRKTIDKSKIALDLVPRIFVLALVSQFDAFLGNLLRSLFVSRPSLIKGSDHDMTLSQLLKVGTIKGAVDYILDKEIESVLRKSRTEQFKWMEERFSIKLCKDLDSWPTFIEVTERRNLFAHTNGIISDQYLQVCEKHNVQLDELSSKGTKLSVTPEYFKEAHACHLEIGIKLAQVLWRKLLPDDTDNADDSLIDITYELIVDNHLDIAKRILDFAVKPFMKIKSNNSKLTLIINRAQSYKWSGDNNKCLEIIENEDWSACDNKYKLAVAVLNDDFKSASDIMRNIGSNGTISKLSYQEWPLFREFRKSDIFMETYANIFGETFVHIEVSLREDEERKLKDTLETLKNYLESDNSDLEEQ